MAESDRVETSHRTAGGEMAPAAVPTLPDEALEVIFLRLGGAADLARVSGACATFRRLVRGHLFLRRFHALHPPPVLGFLHNMAGSGAAAFLPAEPPHRSAPSARALLGAADLAFSFLPPPLDPPGYWTDRPWHWSVRDARDARVLLSRRVPTDNDFADRLLFWRTSPDDAFADLVVCDPLHRRYVQIPAIPEDLVPIQRCDGMKFQPFLAPACKDEEDPSFRVLYNVVSQDKVVTLDFSSVTGKWRHATSFSFSPERLILSPPNLRRYCVCGSFYWANHHEHYMLVLDPLEMKFSLVKLPHKKGDEGLAVVDAGEDRLGLLALNFNRTLDLYCKTCRNNVVCKEDWQHHKTIPLPENNSSYWRIKGTTEGYLLMGTCEPSKYLREEQFFTLDLKTLLFERMHAADKCVPFAHLYASFPPPLSPPSI